MPSKVNDQIIDALASSISDDVGNSLHDELNTISDNFDKSLTKALDSFNSDVFDDHGFIKNLKDLDLGIDKNNETVKNVLNGIKADYVSPDVMNQTEILLRRDIKNICTQMPEMRDVIYLIRDSIIEANTATGEVSRSLLFTNYSDKDDNKYETEVKTLEENKNLQMAIKNFIIPHVLESGEMYVHVVPYKKLFAELEVLHDKQYPHSATNFSSDTGIFKESLPVDVSQYLHENIRETDLNSSENLKYMMESVSPSLSTEISNDYKLETEKNFKEKETISSEMSELLSNIKIYEGSSILSTEMSYEGYKQFLIHEYKESNNIHTNTGKSSNLFLESLGMADSSISGNVFNTIDQDEIKFDKYDDVKGCYERYCDPLKMIPIRIDRRVVGYYYVTTTMDLQNNAAHPNGMVDVSFQHYTKNKSVVDKLAGLIIKSFNKKMLDKNIKLKSEIAEIIMAHKFSDGKLSFVYIPENEIVRFVINEDENGKGHSVLEPTLFPARSYLMLNLYNMIYTLNNNLTRIHYLRSSGLNKNYAAQIQRTMRKFQSRRITIDDIYSYQGVLNKIGGMGEMVLPLGRGGDYKAIETDSIEPVNNPISTDFLEQQRRQALSGTGAPNLLIINAIDEVDFAKTLELANARFQSTVGSYKIDMNKGCTKLYQKIMSYCTNIDENVIKAFKFKFNEAKQQDLNITNDMISNFNNLVELVETIYYDKTDLESEKSKDKDNISHKRKNLRRALAKKYLPQIDIDELDELIKEVDLESNEETLQNRVSNIKLSDEELKAAAGEEEDNEGT